MNFLATAGHPRGDLDGELSKADAKDFYRRIREANCVAMRLHANVWPEWWYEAADEVGMPLIMESALFCYPTSYALSRPKFWENYRRHLEAIIKHKRNHPSIVMYSLENEILHCRGDSVEGAEHRLAEAGRFVKTLDPTRPIMYDADGDPEGVADVVNLHYPQDFAQRNLWPNVGYWLETGMKVRGWPREFWQWDRKKPLYFGEFLHIQHYTEADHYTVVIGDDAYLDHDLGKAKAKAIVWGMQVEAYRAAGVTGLCPWTLTETGAFPSLDNPRYLAVRRAYQKNAAFVREYDTRFYANETVDRTVYVYNDTLHPAQLTFVWELKRGDTVVGRGQQDLSAQPAQKFETMITLKMPSVAKRTELSLTLRVLNGGTPAFDESRRYWAFPRRKLRVPSATRIAVFEAENKTVSKLLREAGVEVVPVSDLTLIPKADVLIIGPHALDGIQRESDAFVVGEASNAREALAAFVRAGGTVIALEQDSYAGGLLPADLYDRGCTIAFQRTRDERLFNGIADDDFCFWRGDHVVCRKTIVEPQTGKFRAHLDSGGPAGLVYLPLCEIVEGRGRYLLSQLAIGEKLDREPMAQVMLENMLSYARAEPFPTVSLAIVQDELPISAAMNEIDVHFTDISGRVNGTDLGAFGAIIAEADCAEVAGNQAAIREYVARGGKMILHRGTREGYARIQSLFPEPIAAQRSTAIPVSIAAWDPAINGLTNQDLYWYGSRKGLNYRVLTPLSPDVCHYGIGAGLPQPEQCLTVEAESMSVEHGKPRVGERDVYMGSRATIKKVVEFPRTGDYSIAVKGKGTPLGGVYPQIRITLDGQRRGSITTDGEEWGTYSISTPVTAGRHEMKLSFVNDAWAPEKGEDRNAWIDKVVYGPTPTMTSKRLLSPAALVKVPLGKGFYLLDQVRWTGEAASSEKAGRYLSNILTNLNCKFGHRASATIITGSKLQPEEGTRLFRKAAGSAYLGTNATLYAMVRFGKTCTYHFAVKASGTEAGGEYPNIDLAIDGDNMGSLTLTRPGWQTLRFKADVPAGGHKVALSFTNDFYDPPADRNLRIGHLEIK